MVPKASTTGDGGGYEMSSLLLGFESSFAKFQLALLFFTLTKSRDNSWPIKVCI